MPVLVGQVCRRGGSGASMHTALQGFVETTRAKINKEVLQMNSACAGNPGGIPPLFRDPTDLPLKVINGVTMIE